jgi:hypothetical protein
MTSAIYAAGRGAAFAWAVLLAQVPIASAQDPARKLQPSVEACLKAPSRTCLLQEAVEEARALVTVAPELAISELTGVGRTMIVLKRDREASHLFAEAQRLAGVVARRAPGPGANAVLVDAKAQEAIALFQLGRIDEALALVTPSTRGIADAAVTALAKAGRPDEARAFLPGVYSGLVGFKRAEIAEAYARAGATAQAIAELGQVEQRWKVQTAGKMIAAAEGAGHKAVANAVTALFPEDAREAVRRSAVTQSLAVALATAIGEKRYEAARDLIEKSERQSLESADWRARLIVAVARPACRDGKAALVKDMIAKLPPLPPPTEMMSFIAQTSRATMHAACGRKDTAQSILRDAATWIETQPADRRSSYHAILYEAYATVGAIDLAVAGGSRVRDYHSRLRLMQMLVKEGHVAAAVQILRSPNPSGSLSSDLAAIAEAMPN